MDAIVWLALGALPFILGMVAGMRIEEFSLASRERRLAAQRRLLNEDRSGEDRVAA